MSKLQDDLKDIKHDVNHCFVPSMSRNNILKDLDSALTEAIAVEGENKKLKETQEKRAKAWSKHNRDCMIYRFSALGCRCGLQQALKESVE